MPIGNRLGIDFSEAVQKSMNRSRTTREELHEEIVRFLTRHRGLAAKDPDVQQRNWTANIPYRGYAPADLYDEILRDPQRRYHDRLDEAEREWYLYFHGANFMWDTVVSISEVDHASDWWERRWEPRRIRQEARDSLPRFLAFVRELPFRVYGRIVLLGVAPFQPVYAHQDEPEHLTEFMLLSFQPASMRKRLVIRSSDGWQETFDVCGLWFDEGDEHEVPPSPWFNYTIRVDGELDDDLLASVVPRAEWPRLRRTLLGPSPG